MRQPVLVMACAVLTGVLAACGGTASAPGTDDGRDAPGSSTAAAPPGGSPAPSPSSGAPPPSSALPSSGPPSGQSLPADLTVTMEDGAGATTTWTLTCDPAGGGHPDAQEACAALAAGAGALTPLQRGVACTQVYGGPQTARVAGTVAGSPVIAELSRTDGCEIDRWDALVPLVPAITGGT